MCAGLGRSPVEVQRCPLDSRGSAHLPMVVRSSGAHWDRELAVEVQQCPLRSGAGGGEEEKEKAAEEGGESYLKIKQPSPGRSGKKDVRMRYQQISAIRTNSPQFTIFMDLALF